MAAHVKDADPKLTRRQAENARAAINVGRVVRKLQQNLEGEIQLTPGQVKSAMILLDKSLPTLQAIDSHVVTDAPTKSPAELERTLLEYISAHPALAERLVNPSRTIFEHGQHTVIEAG